MRIPILTFIPSLYGGGAEKIVADLSFALSKRFNHKILTYNRKHLKYPYSGELEELDLKIEHNLFNRFFKQFLIYKKVLSFKQSFNPKVTISHMLIANMLNVLTSRKSKTICVLHGEWSIKTGKSKLLDKFLVKRLYAKADLIVFVSHYIEKMFQEYYSLDVPHEVAYIGINIEEVNLKATEEGGIELPENYLVYVAGFRPVKNHIILIENLETYLKVTDIFLVLVGDGELRTHIEKKISNLGLSHKIILTGNVQNPYPIIKNAKISLLVSSSESFSLVIVESMALGTPVIATDCGGPREIIDPDWSSQRSTPLKTEYGVLVGTPNTWLENELVNQINEILNMPLLVNNLINKGKERAEKFNMLNVETKYIEIIESLLVS
jgi:glycosyltransferase involved in cell wall biosynthesis